MSERLSLDAKIARARAVPDIRGREPQAAPTIVDTHLALSSAVEPFNTLKEAVMNRGDKNEMLDVAAETVARVIGLALTVAEPEQVTAAIFNKLGDRGTIFKKG